MEYEATFKKPIEIQNFFECFIWKMPGRKFRKTIHVETVLFAEFILYQLVEPLWDYPVTVKYNDRPDFVIKSEKGIIGVEITEQWSKYFGQALSMLDKSDSLLQNSDFAYSDIQTKKIKGVEIASLVSKTKLTGSPSMGYQEEIDWVKRTIRTIKKKEKKYLNYPEKDKFCENILIIFDVRPESPDFKDLTEQMLQPLYELGKKTIFGKIYCLDSKFIYFDLKKKNFVLEESRLKKGNSYFEQC